MFNFFCFLFVSLLSDENILFEEPRNIRKTSEIKTQVVDFQIFRTKGEFFTPGSEYFSIIS